jgi:hypothetical protein
MHSSALFRSQYQLEYNGFELEIFSPPTTDVGNSIQFVHYCHYFFLGTERKALDFTCYLGTLNQCIGVVIISAG